jgi:hypothetical protein
MKYLYGLLLISVMLTGCKPVKYQVKDNEIRVSGVSGDQISQVVQKTFTRYHWTDMSSEYSSSVSHTNFSKTSTIRRKLSTTTEEGKPLSVEILETNDQPVLVTIHSTPDSKYTTPFIIQQLLGDIHATGITVSNVPAIRIDNLALSEDAASYHGTWIAEGDWNSPTPFINIQLQTDKQVIQYTLDRRTITRFNVDNNDARHLPQDFTITTLAGKMQFSSTPQVEVSVVSGSTVIFDIDTEYRQTIQACVKESINDQQFLGLFFYPLDPAYAQQAVKAMEEKQSLSDLLRLKNHQIEPPFIEKVYAAGYHFGVDRLIRAKNHQVSPQFMAEFKNAKYDFTLDQLIRIKNYQLNADTFKTFRDAGYDFSIDEQIRAKNYQISAKTAARLKEMGCNYSLDELIRLKNYQLTPDYIGAFKKLDNNYTIDELIRLKNYRISPDYIEAFQKIGYTLSIDNLIKAKNYQVHPEDLTKYADAGYTFTLDEVIKLRNYSVPMDFILGVKQEGYENFTADELIRFRQKNIGAEEILKIRKKQNEPEPQMDVGK